MKDIIKNTRKVYKDFTSGNRVTTFFLILSAYYILNLLTSPLNSGMSGGLEAEHNVVNQALGGIFVVYVLLYDIFSRSKSNFIVSYVLVAFLIYIVIRTYVGLALDNSRRGIFSMSSVVGYCYWGGGLIFCVKFFKMATKETLQRMIQVTIWVFLVFVTFRLFTQKAILVKLGIPAGINQAAHTFFLVPLIILVFKGKLRILLLLFCGFVCIYSAKRIAALGFLIVTLFAIKIIYQSYVRRRKMLFVFVMLTLYYAGYNFFERVSYDLVHRQQRLELREDEDSGRFELWEIAITGFSNSSQTTQFWGGGPGTGTRHIAQYLGIARAPHNGFIQVMCDFGYLGLILYITFFVVLLMYTAKIKGVDNKLLYLSICFSWIFINVISHPASPRCIFLGIGIGYLLYLQNYEKDRVGK